MQSEQITAALDIKERVKDYVDKMAGRSGFDALFSAQFGDEGCIITIELQVNKDAQFNTPEALEFKAWAQFYGLTPEHLGLTYASLRDKYVLIGSNRKSRKYPALGRSVKTGKIYKTAMPTADKFDKFVEVEK